MGIVDIISWFYQCLYGWWPQEREHVIGFHWASIHRHDWMQSGKVNKVTILRKILQYCKEEISTRRSFQQGRSSCLLTWFLFRTFSEESNYFENCDFIDDWVDTIQEKPRMPKRYSLVWNTSPKRIHNQASFQLPKFSYCWAIFRIGQEALNSSGSLRLCLSWRVRFRFSHDSSLMRPFSNWTKHLHKSCLSC